MSKIAPNLALLTTQAIALRSGNAEPDMDKARAELRALLAVARAADDLVEVRKAVSGMLWEEASGRMYPKWEKALRALSRLDKVSR